MSEKQTVKKRHWAALMMVCLAASLPFVFLYVVSRRSIINEVRTHAMGVAIATAAGIDADDLAAIGGEESMDTEAYTSIQQFLDRIGLANPDVRYIYTMRRARDPLAPSWLVEFVVDQPARDFDRDGIIEKSEMSELPGANYDASEIPELIRGFYAPTADHNITPDPPYPDLLSGYAPIKNAEGETLGIVGVDITAKTIREK